jgi:hypothetical protein
MRQIITIVILILCVATSHADDLHKGNKKDAVEAFTMAFGKKLIDGHVDALAVSMSEKARSKYSQGATFEDNVLRMKTMISHMSRNNSDGVRIIAIQEIQGGYEVNLSLYSRVLDTLIISETATGMIVTDILKSDQSYKVKNGSKNSVAVSCSGVDPKSVASGKKQKIACREDNECFIWSSTTFYVAETNSSASCAHNTFGVDATIGNDHTITCEDAC